MINAITALFLYTFINHIPKKTSFHIQTKTTTKDDGYLVSDYSIDYCISLYVHKYKIHL